jgi:hypothetical protein
MRLPEAFHAHPAYLSVWIVRFWLCIAPEIVLSVLLDQEEQLRNRTRVQSL